MTELTAPPAAATGNQGTPARSVAAEAYLHCLAFVLIALGGLCLAAVPFFHNPHRQDLVLLPDSALLAVLAGYSLLASARGRRIHCLVGSVLVLGLAAYSLVHNVLAGGIDQGSSLISGYWRMRNELASIACLFGLALLFSTIRQGGTWLCRLTGLALIGISLLSQLTAFLPGTGLLHIAIRPDTASIANLLIAMLGVAILLLRAQPSPRVDLPDRRALGIGLFGAFSTALGWFLVSLNGIASLNAQSDQLLLHAQASIERTVTERLQLINRMAERWQSLGTMPSESLWHQETGSYLRDFKNLKLMAVLDSELRLQQQQGRGQQARDWLSRFLAQPELRQWLIQVQLGDVTRMSPTQRYSAQDDSSLIATPLRIGNQPTGLLVACINIGDVLHEQLGKDLGSYVLQAYEGEQLIYDSQNGQGERSPFPTGERLAVLEGSGQWRLVTYQALPPTDMTSAYLPPLFMLFGLGFTFFLMISQGLARLAVERSQSLQRSNQDLEHSLRLQARLQTQNQRIMDHSMDVLCSIDEADRFIQISPSCLAILGYTPEELMNRRYTDFIHPEDRERTQIQLRTIIHGETREAVRNRCLRRDGSIVHLLWSAGWSASERTLFAVAHDITYLVRHEAYAEDQRDILSMISTDQPLPNILSAICEMSETLEPGSLCAVMLADTEKKQLFLGAAPSLAEHYRQAIDGLPIGPLATACGTAVFRRQMVTSQDISEDPLWHDYRDLALRHGLRACWSIPLISHHGDVLGTFAVYRQQPASPGDDALQLMSTAGQLAAIAIERQNDRLRLQDSEQRYRSLFTFNPDPVFATDRLGRYFSLNRACCERVGYSESELLGQDFSTLLLDDDVERVKQHYQAVLNGEAQRFEVQCRTRQGDLMEMDITQLPIVVEGKIVGVFGIAKEIGERNRMTRALRDTLQQSERKALLLRGLSETAVHIGGILDPAALVEYMCGQLRQLIGAHRCAIALDASRDETDPLQHVSLSDDYAASQSPLPAAASHASSEPVLLTRAELEANPAADHRDGTEPLSNWLSAPLIDHGGKLLGQIELSDKFQGDFDQDDLAITQQFAQMAIAALENIRLVRQVLASEQRLQEQLDFTSAITQSVGEGLLAIDRQGLVTYVNPAAAGLLGQAANTLLGHPLGAYLPLPLDCEGAVSFQSRHGETSLDDDRGVIRHIAYDCAPLRHARALGGWVVAFRDITRAKESEKQLRILQRSLEASYNGAMICDAEAEDLPIIYVNPAFERITGYSAGEVLGRNCRFLQGTDHAQAGVAEIRKCLEQKREVHVVLRNFRKDGTPFWNDLYIAPVPDEQGRITHFIGVQNDISEQKRVESELAYNASHDVLTGLPNRSLLEDRLRQGCQISQRYQRQLAVMFIDLDGFKPINDSMGHSIGDQILVEVAHRLGQQVRPGDTVARLGGDEFILVLPDLARGEDVLQIAERVIDCIARPYPVSGSELHITASLGIAMSEGGMQQPMQLIQQADLAMYKAKQQGRNCYQWYTSDLEQKVSERVTLRNELQKAIESNAFTLHYQPQIDGRNGRVAGYEALLRWQHPALGYISPMQFIPIAEDTGQIIPLSEWVLATACRDCRELLDRGISGAVVAVNISAVHFQRSIFVDSVQRILEETRLPAELLELEITETVLLDNAERAIGTLQALKALGVRLAIDDFGTGFSSLNYLKRLPIDKVKIDRAFVQEIISDRHDAAITQGIISMAHHLGLRVIAEGVENESQFAFLKKSHCDEFQGYYFARPMPFADLETFLREHHKSPAAYLSSRTGAPSTQTLLLIDDEENILRALTRVLRRDGYQILTASRAQDAFTLLAKHDIQVILSDQRMPELNGTEFFSLVKDLYPETVRIVLSGYTDLKSVTDAINQGAIYKFLTKPWDDDQLRAAIAQAFLHHSLAQNKEASPAELAQSESP